MTRYRKWIVTAGLGMVALALLVGIGTVMPRVVAAQDDAPTAQVEPEASRTDAEAAPPDRMRGERGADYLAEALDITAAELQTAEQTAFENAVDLALEQGLITDAQAEALKERAGPGRGGRGGHGGPLGIAGTDIDMDELLAASLGISVEALAEARQAADEAALKAQVEAGRLTAEEADLVRARRALQTYLQDGGLADEVRALYEQAVRDAVSAGVIAQEQADAILAETGFGLRGLGFGPPGMGGGHGDMHDGPPAMDGFGLGAGVDSPWQDRTGSGQETDVTPSGDSL